LGYTQQEDYYRAIAAMIRKPPADWKRPLGRPSHTWFRAVETDLGQQNIDLASAWRKAAIREDCRRIVDTATKEEVSVMWVHSKAVLGFCCVFKSNQI